VSERKKLLAIEAIRMASTYIMISNEPSRFADVNVLGGRVTLLVGDELQPVHGS
jgi:hypothetical protein